MNVRWDYIYAIKGRLLNLISCFVSSSTAVISLKGEPSNRKGMHMVGLNGNVPIPGMGPSREMFRLGFRI